MTLVIQLDRWLRQIGVSSGLVAELRLHLESRYIHSKGEIPPPTDVFGHASSSLAWKNHPTQLVRNN
jgi:hypothetical protein